VLFIRERRITVLGEINYNSLFLETQIIAFLRCVIPVVFKNAKDRRILVSQNTTVYMC